MWTGLSTIHHVSEAEEDCDILQQGVRGFGSVLLVRPYLSQVPITNANMSAEGPAISIAPEPPWLSPGFGASSGAWSDGLPKPMAYQVVGKRGIFNIDTEVRIRHAWVSL